MTAMFPAQAPGISGAADAQSPMQEQFAELRDTWQESTQKWTELLKQGPQAAPITPKALRDHFTPARWSGTGTGSFDAGLRHLLEGPKYAQTRFSMAV